MMMPGRTMMHRWQVQGLGAIKRVVSPGRGGRCAPEWKPAQLRR